VLAYLVWHVPAPGRRAEEYERALRLFHNSLAHLPPSGFRGSAAFGVDRPPPLSDGRPGDHRVAYEDWYLIDGWDALGVLEEAAVSHGHRTRHRAVAELATQAVAGVYRLTDGHALPARARVAVWVAPGRDHEPSEVADLLADGMDRECAGLWRRCLGLGPAPEYCLLAPEAPAGVAARRLPPGWDVQVHERRALWDA
jgi:hypothetical protein